MRTGTRRKNTYKWIGFAFCALVCMLLGVCAFMASPLFAVTEKRTDISLEAGSRLDLSASDFLEGGFVNLSYVDTSALKTDEVGEYPVTIYHGFRRFTQTVTITDTTAPSLDCDVQNITLKKGEYVTVGTIGVRAEDNTQIDRLLFHNIRSDAVNVDKADEDELHLADLFAKGRDIWTESYTFTHGGIYTLTVYALDVHGNSNTLTLDVTVEEPPVVEAVPDVYLSTGNSLDFDEYVTAWDFLDGKYGTEDIDIDASGVNIAKTGEYQVTYSIKDDYGLTGSAVTNVHIYSKADLQELINTHEINKSDDVIVGAINPYDSGFYDTNDPEFIQNAVLPTLVHINNDALDAAGSGYILKIDENFVTIATNEHVINSDMTPMVTFYDGSSCQATVVAADPREDIAFIRIPIGGESSTASLATDYVENLRTVHINLKFWEKLDNLKEIPICYTCIDDTGETWTGAIGYMVYKSVSRDWNEYRDVNECIISPDPVPGSSGSAVFDGHGRLIGMVRGYNTYSNDSVETVAVPLKEILDYYQRVFNEPLQYM